MANSVTSPQYQLAIALFEELEPQGHSVKNAPKDLGFRRSNAFAQIVDLGLAARRFVDVAYFMVAEAGPELKPLYQVDLGLFKWLMCYSSANMRHFNGLIRDAQKAAIELTDLDSESPSNDRYGSVPLLGPAFVDNGNLYFELSERLQRTIKAPANSHFLSICHVFSSIHAKVLYDRLLTLPMEGLTPWYSVDDLRTWLNCHNQKTYANFKHFRARVLDFAIEDIRRVTGLNIELITRNVPKSKKVGHVRFKLQSVSSLEANPQKTALLVLKELYEILRSEFALSRDEFNEILMNRETYTDKRIYEAIDYTRHAAENGKIKLRAAGYFMKALREGYVLGTLDKQIQERRAGSGAGSAGAKRIPSPRRKTPEQPATDEMNKGMLVFEALSAAEKEAVLSEFSNSTLGKRTAKQLKIEPVELKNRIEDPILRGALSGYLSAQVKTANRSLGI